MEFDCRVADTAGRVYSQVEAAQSESEVRHRLFEPFFTTKRENGTGLGLWVTKSLVDKQDGSLRFRSTLGVGTTFSVFLPSNVADAKVA